MSHFSLREMDTPYIEVSPAFQQHGAAKARSPPCSALRHMLRHNPDKLREKVAKWQKSHRKGVTRYKNNVIVCVVKPGATNKDGYQQVNLGNIGNVQQTAYYHHVAVWAARGEDALPVSWQQSISHLCHHTDCVNPEHMVLEEHWKNVRRQSCPGPDDCSCDETHKCILPS